MSETKNQKILQGLLEKYRKHKWGAALCFIIAGTVVFLIPEAFFSTFKTLFGYVFSSSLAAKVAGFVEFATAFFGSIGGVYNAFKAIDAKSEINELKKVDDSSLTVSLDESKNLIEKDEKEEIEKVKNEVKNNYRVKSYHDDDYDYDYIEENQKVKKYTR